jgi:hypothetical protein
MLREVNMVAVALSIVAVIVLAVLAVAKGAFKINPDLHEGRWWVLAAQILLGAYAAFWLYFTFGEVFGGDISGLSHLPPALASVGLIYLARKLPLETGFVLLALGVMISAYFLVALDGGISETLPAMVLMSLPYIAAGLLLVVGGILAKVGAKEQG